MWAIFSFGIAVFLESHVVFLYFHISVDAVPWDAFIIPSRYPLTYINLCWKTWEKSLSSSYNGEKNC